MQGKLQYCRGTARCIAVVAALGSLGLAGFCVVAQHSPQAAIRSFEETRDGFKSSEALILDRRGDPLQTSRVRYDERRIGWVPLRQVSRDLIGLILASEDRRFEKHGGVDWRALARASMQWAAGGRRQGGSTVTMQVASLLSGATGKRKGIWDKLEQLRSARRIEGSWSKEEILEAYVNLVPFRGELRGIAAASQELFGKDPHGLTVQESALLAAMIRSPNAGELKLASRACGVLRAADAAADCAGIDEAARKVILNPQSGRLIAASAPLAARELIRRFPEASVIRSTLDSGLQREVAQIMTNHLLPLRDQNARDAAVLVADNETGEILVYAGNLGDKGSARYVDGIRSRRSAGSTLKPFLYAAAIDARLVTAASRLDDAPLNIPGERGVYRPEDYDREFRGPVTVRTALASSLNIPAVQMLKLLGVEQFAAVLRKAGIPPAKDPSVYGYSMALGTPSVSLWELVTGYRAIARGGVRSGLKLSSEDSPGTDTPVFSPEAAFIISDILSDRESRSATFGLENPLATRYWSAAKTGTSRDMTDNWCVGFTRRYTVGVWVGNFSGEPMWNVTGITGAAPIWVETMNLLVDRHHGADLGAPDAPASLVEQPREGGREWFLPGTDPVGDVQVRAALGNPRVIYPASGMVVAYDPEVGEDRQKIRLRAAPEVDGITYVMDGTELGGTHEAVWWKVAKGRHTLQLRGKHERVLDAVTFTVR